MPQLQNLQKVEALRETISRSTLRVLQILQLRHLRIDLQCDTTAGYYGPLGRLVGSYAGLAAGQSNMEPNFAISLISSR